VNYPNSNSQPTNPSESNTSLEILHENKTVLHQIVINKNPVVLEFLLQWPCDVDAIDIFGCTPLHYAAALDQIRIILLLLRRNPSLTIRNQRKKVKQKTKKKKKNFFLKK